MKNKNITSGTIARTLILLFALANQFLQIAGYSPLPFNDEQVTQAVTFVCTAVASVLAWWKNNSFTKKAIEADASKEV